MVMLTFELKTVNWYCELWVCVTHDDNNNGYLHLWLILCYVPIFLCYCIRYIFFSIFPSFLHIFHAAWTPYGTMALIGSFGDKVQINNFILMFFFALNVFVYLYLTECFLINLKNLLTPGVTMIPACACKFVACLDPYVYAISHPRYRYWPSFMYFLWKFLFTLLYDTFITFHS